MEVNINRANNSRSNPTAFMVLKVKCSTPHYNVVVNEKNVTFGYLIS